MSPDTDLFKSPAAVCSSDTAGEMLQLKLKLLLSHVFQVSNVTTLATHFVVCKEIYS